MLTDSQVPGNFIDLFCCGRMGTCCSHKSMQEEAGHELVAIKRHAIWSKASKIAANIDDHEFSTWDLMHDTSHNDRTTSFCHPVTGQVSSENMDFVLQDQSPVAHVISKPAGEQLSSTAVSETSTTITSSTVDTTSAPKTSRPSSRVHSFGKRDQAIRRNPNVPVVVRGWLYKQDSSGMRLWKRKWFVLSDYCLFYYKDSREETVLGSIPLPSYVIAPVEPEDHINRRYAFKASHTGMRSYIYNKNSVIGSQAEHCGMRTYFFSADTQEDMNGWIRAMNQAALMQQSHTVKRDVEKSAQQAVPQTNHIHVAQKSESVHSTNREEALRDEGTYGSDVQGRSIQSTQQEKVGRLSPDTSVFKSGQPTVIQVVLPPEQNGNVVYQRGFVSRMDSGKHVQRKNTLAQVEQWVKVHKGDPTKSASPAEYNLPRRTPPLKPKASATESTYHSLPKSPRLLSGSSSPPTSSNLPSDYKYAHDRLSHFRMSTDERMASKEGMVWQLYEWQQRQQFRHGSPTAPIYTGPSFTDASSFRVTVEMPRSISVPPSPCEVPPSTPPSFKPLSPRRPHTPSDRRTIRPLDEMGPGDSTRSSSPGNICSRLSQTSQLERRSVPAMGYITHTVSAPSLHGKTADDTYQHLKKDLEYLDLKVAGGQTLKESGKPVKAAESDVDVKLSRLCEQDKILKELEARISSLKDDKDKLERVLDMSHQQMEQYQEQPTHVHKIAYQQRLLQEDLVSVRAQMSQLSTEMAHAWEEYNRLEMSVEQLRTVLQAHMNHSDTPQPEKTEMKRELWRIEDVMAGLSTSKANYKITIDSIQNPDRKLVPSLSEPTVPSLSSEVQPPPRSSVSSILSHTSTVPSLMEDNAPPRPPLPRLYDYEEIPPVVPPLPREASVIRHTSVRGLKRQSDGRRRDREGGQYVTNGDSKTDLRSYLSEPELPGSSHQNTGIDADYQDYPSTGPLLKQSNTISSFVTLRRGPGSSAAKERPKSAFERLSSPTEVPSSQPRGRMTAEEQLERMKRHQKALVRERKRNLSQGERSSSGLSTSSPRLPSSPSDPSSSVRYPSLQRSNSRHREHHHQCCYTTLQPPAT
uniref:Pleckstrin homology domain containing, family A member 7b n=1 Tax=Nothobranchius kadleci TaxID=1051664 RepID=A0A1A8D9W4_NOTKA